ncbi:hypothetical protein [Chitinophaga sp.]|uniref:hypothetical protein n=1 Tax=Chitinophaga sp. TaxID=1869181 RepID=UPI002F93568D
MFKNVLKAVEEMAKNKVHIPIDTDSDGYIDRECPNEQCLFQFKVHLDDWKNLFQDEVIYCPMCRKEANSTSWFTQQQLKDGREEAQKHILNVLDKGFREDAKVFNTLQNQNAFFSIKMNFKGEHVNRPILPIAAMEEMELKISCKECNARYAVIGSAFFCPCCGHNSAQETFGFSLDKIKVKLTSIPIIQASFNKDDAAILTQNLIESSLVDLVVAFQRFCEVTFRQKAPNIDVRFNAFQKLDLGSSYWKDHFGQGYEDWLTIDEMRILKIFFQQRHLLAHSEGFVDQSYIDRSGDVNYILGQKLVIKEDNVRGYLRLIELMTSQINNLP